METGKIAVSLSSAYRLLYPRQVVLVTCADKTGKVKPIYHFGGDDFTTIGPEIITPRLRKPKSTSQP